MRLAEQEVGTGGDQSTFGGGESEPDKGDKGSDSRRIRLAILPEECDPGDDDRKVFGLAERDDLLGGDFSFGEDGGGVHY
jgi:hypothetical protein